jgi:hypothetical protein
VNASQVHSIANLSKQPLVIPIDDRTPMYPRAESEPFPIFEQFETRARFDEAPVEATAEAKPQPKPDVLDWIIKALLVICTLMAVCGAYILNGGHALDRMAQ